MDLVPEKTNVTGPDMTPLGLYDGKRPFHLGPYPGKLPVPGPVRFRKRPSPDCPFQEAILYPPCLKGFGPTFVIVGFISIYCLFIIAEKLIKHLMVIYPGISDFCLANDARILIHPNMKLIAITNKVRL